MFYTLAFIFCAYLFITIMSLKVYVIAAACEDFGIGVNGDLPWRLKNELEYFHRMTTSTDKPGTKNVVIMGSKTYFSNPKSIRPLPDRLNIVLSRKPVKETGVLTFALWEQAITHCQILKNKNVIDKVWVIGGYYPYKVAMQSPLCSRAYLTRIKAKFNCDTFFPGTELCKFRKVDDDPSVPTEEQNENGIRYRFEIYQRNCY